MSAKPKLDTGPMLGMPLSRQQREFLKWVKTGRRPDEHPAVRPHSLSPPETAEINVIGEVSLQESYADNQSYFPCNVCNTARKFKEGGFCAQYGDGHWYIVGPDCGSDTHKRKFGAALRNYRHEQLEAESEDRVARFYQNFQTWTRTFHRATDIAALILKAQDKLLSIEDLRNDLKSAKGQDGKLWIDRLAVILDGWDKIETIETEHFVTLKGLNFLNRPSIPIHKSKIAKAKLAVIAGDDLEQNHFLDLFQIAQRKKRMRKLRTDVRAAEEAVRDLLKSIGEMQSFLNPQQLGRIHRYYVERRKAAKEFRKSNFPDLASGAPDVKLAINTGRLKVYVEDELKVDLELAPILEFEASPPY